MKKVIIMLFFCIEIILGSIERPVLRSGIKTYNYFKIQLEDETIYPSTIKDNLYISVEEAFSDFFKIMYRFDIKYSNYNKYSLDLHDLNAYEIKNRLKFFFNIRKKSKIQLEIQPTYNYKYGEEYYRQISKILYSLRLKYFRFSTYYSNNFTSKEDDLFYHKIGSSFYWYFKKSDIIKYKASYSIYFQHYIDNEIEISPIKSANLSFEIILDFNKIDIEEIFNKKDDNEDDFFEQY